MKDITMENTFRKTTGRKIAKSITILLQVELVCLRIRSLKRTDTAVRIISLASLRRPTTPVPNYEAKHKPAGNRPRPGVRHGQEAIRW